MDNIVIYILAQLVNVVFGTMRYIATVKSSRLVATIITSCSCTLSALITYLLVRQEFIVVIITTCVTNLIGFPIGDWIISKFDKERLWIYEATIRCSEEKIRDLRGYLKDTHGIHSNWSEITFNHLYSMRIYVYTKNESRIVKNEFSKLDVHYNIIESLS